MNRKEEEVSTCPKCLTDSNKINVIKDQDKKDTCSKCLKDYEVEKKSRNQ